MNLKNQAEAFSSFFIGNRTNILYNRKDLRVAAKKDDERINRLLRVEIAHHGLPIT
jgi:hypothetical protein